MYTGMYISGTCYGGVWPRGTLASRSLERRSQITVETGADHQSGKHAGGLAEGGASQRRQDCSEVLLKLKPYPIPGTCTEMAFTLFGRGSSFPEKLDKPVSGSSKCLLVNIWG